MLNVPIGPHEHMVHDYALLSQRKLDVRIPAQTIHATEYVIKPPLGARIVAMPGATTSTTPFGSLEVTVEPLASGVRVKTTITITKTRISAGEYPAFRKWCEAVDAALGQRLVMALGPH